MLANNNENTMQRICEYVRQLPPVSRRIHLLAVLTMGLLGTPSAAVHAQSSVGWDVPFNHELGLNDVNIIVNEIEYGPELLGWTNETRVLAIQSLNGKNPDLTVTTSDGNVFVSQDQDTGDIDFAVFEGSTPAENGEDPRPTPECTTHLYLNNIAADGGIFYLQYVKARGFDAWDGSSGYADLRMNSEDLVQAIRVYLRGGIAYRFEAELGDPAQVGEASLVPTNYQTRIQTRPQTAVRFRWGGGRDGAVTYVPEEGWYTLVVAQTAGRALGLAHVRNTVEIGRGDAGVTTNNIRISVHPE